VVFLRLQTTIPRFSSPILIHAYGSRRAVRLLQPAAETRHSLLQHKDKVANAIHNRTLDPQIQAPSLPGLVSRHRHRLLQIPLANSAEIAPWLI
jgi:hypothetical protein